LDRALKSFVLQIEYFGELSRDRYVYL